MTQASLGAVGRASARAESGGAYLHETIAAVATPAGEGAIAIVRVSGPAALAIAARTFRSARPLDLHGYRVQYGRFVDAAAQVVDDGLLTVFRAPRSFTGEDSIELACHGGRSTAAGVLKIVLDAGARLAAPGEFTRRAFLNGKLDLAQAEAVADLIRAGTEAARRQARRQLDGGLSGVIRAMRDELIGVLAAIEVTIDFSEEVGDLDYPLLEERLAAVYRTAASLLGTAGRGRVLREGLHVAIIGQPNVGKSSLLNRLLGADRAIVTPVAGTTRDTLEEAAIIGGLQVVLTDTAGIRDTEDEVERIGVRRAREAAAGADTVLLVLDSTQGIRDQDRRLFDSAGLSETTALLAAVNKADAASVSAVETSLAQARLAFGLSDDRVIAVSAVTGDGIADLEAALVRPYASGSDGGMEAVVVTAERHARALEKAHGALRHALETAEARLPGDFIAIDVRGALDLLGEIIGETVTDEIVHRIFKDFCVGK